MNILGIEITEILPLEYEPGPHNGRASSPENVSCELEARNAARREEWRRRYEHGGELQHINEKLHSIRTAGFCLLALILAGCANRPALLEAEQARALVGHYGYVRSLAGAAGTMNLCTTHVSRMRALLSHTPEYRAEKVHLCPKVSPIGVCHVLVRVTDPDGQQWAVDNGALVHDQAERWASFEGRALRHWDVVRDGWAVEALETFRGELRQADKRRQP